MSIGTYISVTMHASIVGWLLLNGNFESTPREISVTEVSLVSAEMFDIALNNTPPEVEASIETAVAQPPVEEIAPKLSLKPDAPVMDREQPVMLSPQDDQTPPPISEQSEPLEDLDINPPTELVTPNGSPGPSKLLETSLKPKPRASSRITSKAVAPPSAEAEISDVVRDAAISQNKPAEIKEEQTATAPEASAAEIIPEEVKQTASLAPERSIRPLARKIRQVTEPDNNTSAVSPVTDASLVAAALSEALTGFASDSTSENPVANKKQGEAAFKMAIGSALEPCYKGGQMSTAAERTDIYVTVIFDANGRVRQSSLKAGFMSGDADSVDTKFQVARRALLNNDCSRKLSEIIKSGLADGDYSPGETIDLLF